MALCYAIYDAIWICAWVYYCGVPHSRYLDHKFLNHTFPRQRDNAIEQLLTRRGSDSRQACSSCSLLGFDAAHFWHPNSNESTNQRGRHSASRRTPQGVKLWKDLGLCNIEILQGGICFWPVSYRKNMYCALLYRSNLDRSLKDIKGKCTISTI